MQQQAMSDRRLDQMIQNIQNGSMRMTELDALTIAGQLYGRGRFKQAEVVCRQLIGRKPSLADAHSILGVVLNAQGKGKEGVAALKKAIKLAPKMASYRSNLGEVLRQQGNLADATVALQVAIELDPRNAQAHNNLGIIRFESGAYGEAVKSYQRALEIDPNFPEAYNNLGNALRRTGDPDGAVEAYHSALALREVYPETYNNLGTLLREQGKRDQAEHALRKAVQQNPKHVEALNNLASLYFNDQREVDALRQLGEVLKIAPADQRALVLTARCQHRRGNVSTAEQACRLALKHDPDNAEALSVLGQILHEIDDYEGALEVLQRAVELAPRNPEALNFYGVTLKSVGRFDEARETILKGLEINRKMFGAYANLADLVDYKKDKVLFGRIKTIMESAKNPEAPHFLPLHYAYAKALDDNGKHEKALEHYITGGQLKRKILNYNESETHGFFEAIRKAFPAKLFKDRPFEGDPTDQLVFIVGMPRSGSTLVEQILASHDDIYGAGEVKYFSHALHKLRDRFPSLSKYPDMVPELRSAQYQTLADSYRQMMFKSAGDAKRVTDKMLTNFFFIGLIHLCFPNAKFINTRRDPMDTCLSTFTKLFKDDLPHSYDMGELGRYYRQYDALMKHWEKVLPKGTMKVVEYENVVEDTEKAGRELIEFLGLDWNDKLLDFHKSSRPVKTASVAQVRKPIYKTSVKRWKKYGKGLQPLIDAIEKA